MLGLGVASFGYIDGVHYQNEATLRSYEAAVEHARLPVKRAFALSDRDRLVREFILQLKLGRVPLGPFCRKFGKNPVHTLSAPIRALAAEGFLEVHADAVQLTADGLLRVDRLLPMFYDPQFRGARYT